MTFSACRVTVLYCSQETREIGLSDWLKWKLNSNVRIGQIWSRDMRKGRTGQSDAICNIGRPCSTVGFFSGIRMVEW